MRGERGLLRPRSGRGRALGLGGGSSGLVLAGPGFHCFSVFRPSENYSAEDKYKIWMRHRYNECVDCLAELMGHHVFQVKVGPEPAAGTRVPLGVNY